MEENLIVEQSQAVEIPTTESNLEIAEPVIKKEIQEIEMKYIDKVGVEIEGGWNEDTIEDIEVHSDGSVNVNGDEVGEIHSAPHSNQKELFNWITKYYPDNTHKSCGTHVHFSFKKREYYAAIMDEGFFNFYLEKMKVWGEKSKCSNKNFFRRFNGENCFCYKNFIPFQQIENRGKGDCATRYTHWNFCYHLHGTVECRVLPTFYQSKMAVAAIRKLIKIVEEWLKNYDFEANAEHISKAMAKLPATRRPQRY